MSLEECDAGEKFWANTELVEKLLLPYLDAGSTKSLAKAHGLTLKILGKAIAWDKLIKRAFPVDHEAGIVRDDVSLGGFLAEIVSIAKSSNLPRQDIDWRQMEKDLLHGICRRFANSDEHSMISVSCSCLEETHQVSLLGFLILEKVEAKLESVEQNVLKVVSHRLLEEPVLHALSTRVLRQQERVEEFVFATKQHAALIQERLEGWMRAERRTFQSKYVFVSASLKEVLTQALHSKEVPDGITGKEKEEWRSCFENLCSRFHGYTYQI